MEKGTIKHMAFFTLKHSLSDQATETFLKDGQAILSAIPVVNNFEVLRQTSPKTDFDFGFSMEFANQEDYDTYNNHPSHVSFVEERWKVEVERFQEIDYTIL
ncbi:Dabb family protein [Halalkalibacter sp. APA_J-10(15)]|uniref:Dabb family protein n=1 Tax=unclassified Halalkalibacter TaxID=2893063 RepID=UPI001FF5AD67|nr:Dabb family protein [Halalkalibacter sp. APA_J-10(15)]MCK0471066.1 Dabb family protein [Halalkalibacter sp. APA_J-10(15)]